MKVTVYLSVNQDPVHDYVLTAAMQGWAKIPGVEFGLRCAERDLVLRIPNGDYEPSDVAVVFGTYKKAVSWTAWRGYVLDEQKKRGLTTVVIDSGYVKRGLERTSYYAVGLGGLNGWADFRNEGMPDDRWKALGVEMKPWKQRSEGDDILILGQVPWDASVQHVDLDQFLSNQVRYIKRLNYRGRPLVFRPHPKAPVGSMPKMEALSPPLDQTLAEALGRAFVVVTYNSNSAVDAILAGVPAIVLGEGDMLGGVCSRHIKSLNTPLRSGERGQWAADLAFAQWRPDEMREGLPWKHLFRDV